MKRVLRIVAIIIFFATFLYPQSFVSDVSKKGTTAAPFLSIGEGAKATAMGSAFVGIADDPSAIYWNPAGLSKLQGVNMIFDHTNWIAGISYNFVAASYGLGDLGTVGFSFTSSNYGDMRVTTIDEPEGTGEVFTANDMAISLAYAISLTENFSIGFNPKFIYQSIWNMNASAFALDLGVQYRTPFDGAILAMSISNFGTKMQMQGTNSVVLVDLDPLNGGNNNKIPANLSTGEWSLPLTYRVGIAYEPVKTETNRITLAVDALHPSDNYESLNVGGEYTYNDFISVRGGYKSLFLKDSEETFALGFGIKQYLLHNVAIKVDYAYQNFGRLNNIQKFSVGITF
jgi:long-subunit fatty acid transport protein